MNGFFLSEAVERLQPDGGGLERAGRPLVVRVHDVGIGPHLGIEGAAAGVEDADDFPRARADVQAPADVEPLI
jgi:formyltetrahydrofolate synthetase